MELIITEKNDAAQKIASLLGDAKPKADKVYNTSVYRFTRDGKECVTIGLRGHILQTEFCEDLIYDKKQGWLGLDKDGELYKVDAPEDLPRPPWNTKRKPYTSEGISVKGWNMTSLPYLVYTPVLKSPKEKNIIRSVKNLAKKASSVIIATDFDREGELIGLDALNIVKEENPNIPISRARYSAFIKKEIQQAFSDENLVSLDYNLAYAGETRQDIDLIWGAVLTRYLTLVKRSGFGNPRSAGRVQTPTLALVVEREMERRAFVPEDYWVITADFIPKDDSNGAFRGTHSTARFKVESEALRVMETVAEADEGTVVSIEKKQRKIAPPTPFNTTSLQAAASAIGLRPSRTMRIAESLYMNGYISYPRVDNTVYPAGLDYREILNMLAGVKDLRQGALDLLAKDKLVATRGKKETTDHPPIYPTGVADPEKLRADEWKLYKLIAQRFMATLSDAAVVEGTKIGLDVKGEIFTAKGDVLVVPGFRAVYPYGLKKDEQMPNLEQGQVLDFRNAACAHKQTEPPARYSTGKLIQEMEKCGLGTKATRHDMIEKLYERKYIVNDPIEPTQLGFAVIAALEQYASHITTPQMTATLEEEMNQIAEGGTSLDSVVNHSRRMLDEVMKELIPHKDDIADVISDAVIADSAVGICPKCGGTLCVKSSVKTKSQFVGCNNWPDCDQTYPLPDGRYDEIETPCPECGGLQIKVTPLRFGKPYEHCLDPNCKTNTMEPIDVGECPVCKQAGRDGRLIAQKNPRTFKRYIRCTNYDECETGYPLPALGELEATGETCDACGAPEVIIQRDRGPWRTCVNMECPKKAKKKTSSASKGAKKSTKSASSKTKSTKSKK